MDYRKFGDTYYIRADKGDDIIACVLDVCKKENISSATYSGIGGLSEACIQTFVPERGEFESHIYTGMLELASLTGNVITDSDGGLFHHTHCVIAYKDGDSHRVAGGHTKSLTVLYTGEIELRPVIGGTIKHRLDPVTGTGFWAFPPEDAQ